MDESQRLIRAAVEVEREDLIHNDRGSTAYYLTNRVKERLTAHDEGKARRLRLEVEDTGVGIAPEAQQGLFTHFGQADGSATRQFGGPGLGLAVRRRIARLMGGDVGFRSTPAAGPLL